MEEIVIREWESGDSVEELTALLHRAYAKWGERGLLFTAVDQGNETTRDRLNGAINFVAVQGRRLVGSISVYSGPKEHSPEYYARPGVWFFGQFAVEPSLQGTGIGARLIVAAEQAAGEGGAAELACDTRMGAPELADYYQRRGYSIVAEHHWDDGQDSHVLARTL